ncbi:GntR family transcriptional regulator [Streptomyces ipomoeae]|jgi:GntR family transcriptional regulator|uniref:GntR family transcriptional regulator n=1 Tax=Streptomyces ipomoeae TaxID=103232 RepID=A0A540NYK7_9ACTN|nr:GntR family transcriptional regulator [Streptomyces ipomoeae]MDX2694526.1 GntR family transcriptional regulator [Streptomyces ipomoeae]MDX2822393.1 GntR family transcriptional regulator [Streptomyces ipomoeae]MDX2840107.1 GntR family transcriptional regulator [Streptomyces ipomoeae]MDX2877672.1 GntR family transcriptional regulator [Streptomyces ipomoeae]MDX2931325.1 GntR family transcriptional regulator [Streptomyces ipomoeae]
MRTDSYSHGVTSATTGSTEKLDLSVDRTSPVPLYYQLARQLESAIEHGVLGPGSLLGNEIDLAGRLGLSRPTVRQAIQSLVDKGLLVRRRGVGTQVVHSQVKRPLELSSLYDDLEAAGQQPTTQVLSSEVGPASAEVAAALGIAEGAEVHRFERLRLTHAQPVAFLCNHVPAGLLDLDTERLESTGLYRMLRNAGISLHSAHQTVGARNATPEEAERLGEPEGAALLTMQRTAYDDTGRAVEYGTHIYRASRYSFDFQLLVRN